MRSSRLSLATHIKVIGDPLQSPQLQQQTKSGQPTTKTKTKLKYGQAVLEACCLLTGFLADIFLLEAARHGTRPDICHSNG